MNTSAPRTFAVTHTPDNGEPVTVLDGIEWPDGTITWRGRTGHAPHLDGFLAQLAGRHTLDWHSPLPVEDRRFEQAVAAVVENRGQEMQLTIAHRLAEAGYKDASSWLLDQL